MSEADVIRRTKAGPITVDSLISDLTKLGVMPGMTLIVHSSLSSLGWVCGGPVGVILALEEVLGPAGTLVMPTHSGEYSDPEMWCHPPVPQGWKEVIRQTMPVYDPGLTPTRGMGRIPETFRKQPGVIRSSHPQVSFAARGTEAEYITREHQLDIGLGEGSPLARLYELEAWILLLGVGQENNTSLHLAEVRAHYPGKKHFRQGAPLLVDGQRQWVDFDELEEHSDKFNQIGRAYQRSGGRRSTCEVGRAKAELFPQRDLVDFAVDWMSRHYRF
jgi:aminoglycoside 3-N-acetyltransferase